VKFFITDKEDSVKWVPCNKAGRVLKIAGEGDGLQIWRIAGNTLNMQSWTVDSGWFSSFGAGQEANNL
jgi:hypothetical protein